MFVDLLYLSKSCDCTAPPTCISTIPSTLVLLSGTASRGKNSTVEELVSTVHTTTNIFGWVNRACRSQSTAL